MNNEFLIHLKIPEHNCLVQLTHQTRHVVQQRNKALNVASFTRIFFFTQIWGYTILNKLNV